MKKARSPARSGRKLGRVEEADGGSIFLDEIADMSRPLQAKLLRFLEDGTFTRVGGTQELRVDVRLIAATNRDIITAIKENDFREDLFHRLNVVQFRLAAPARAQPGRAAAGGPFSEALRPDHQKARETIFQGARSRNCWPITGPATCGNCAMSSSAR